MKCKECRGTKEVDWHRLDGKVSMGECPRCNGTGKEPKILFPYGDGDKKTFRKIGGV